MCDDVATNRFLGIGVEHGRRATVDLGDDLVRDDDSDAKLIGKALQRAHEFGQVRLAVAELSAAEEVGSVQGGGGVDNEERKAGLAHHLGCLVEQLQLMIGVVSSCVGNIVEDFFPREAVAVGDREQTDGAEGALGVDVQTLALAAAHVEGQLAGDGEGVANLGLSGAEFAKEFGNTAGFDAAREEGVEVLGAGGDGDELGTALVDLGGGSEAHGHELGCCGTGGVRNCAHIYR